MHAMTLWYTISVSLLFFLCGTGVATKDEGDGTPVFMHLPVFPVSTSPLCAVFIPLITTRKSPGWTILVLSADYRFIGGAMAANESPMLVTVDAETSMAFAHVWKREGADPDVPHTLVEEIEVSGHRQRVFKSDQENPVKAVQRELEARRPEMKLGDSPQYRSTAHASDDLHGEPLRQPSSTDSLWIRVARARWRRHAGRPQTEMA